MKHKLLLIYSWFVRTVMFFLPDAPLFMRVRGFFYKLGLKKCGKNFQIAHNVILNTLETISIGNDVYIAPNVIILGGGEIIIEDEVMIGPGVVIVADNHTFVNDSYRYGPIDYGSIFIGKGSWVAANCTIVKGGYLPTGSILASNSVLNKKYDGKRLLLAGVPAEIKKYL